MASSPAHLAACARYRARHKDMVSASQKKHYLKNKSAITEKNKVWAKNNPHLKKQYSDKYRAANKEKVAIGQAKRSNAHYLSNREKMLANAVAWNRENKQRRAAIRKKWRDENLERVALLNRERSIRRDNATPAWANKFFMNEAYGLARLRTEVMGYKWSVDHIVPIMSDVVCGLHAHTNFRVIPALTNSQKSNLYWPDMPEIEHAN